MANQWIVSCLLMMTFLLAGLALAGYVLDRLGWYTWGETVGMAPNTAIAFLTLSTAGLCHLMDHKPPYDDEDARRWDD